MQRGGKKRRQKDTPPPPMPVWQRIAAAVLFLGLGGAMAALGIWELAGWISALVDGAASMTTDSFILGLPLLGLAMVALGPDFIAPRALALWSDERKAWFGKTILGTMLVGLVLAFTGQIAIALVMEADGYRACHVGGRGRYVDVTWARKDTVCPPAGPSR